MGRRGVGCGVGRGAGGWGVGRGCGLGAGLAAGACFCGAGLGAFISSLGLCFPDASELCSALRSDLTIFRVGI
jgi:hypothetical protein